MPPQGCANPRRAPSFLSALGTGATLGWLCPLRGWVGAWTPPPPPKVIPDLARAARCPLFSQDKGAPWQGHRGHRQAYGLLCHGGAGVRQRGCCAVGVPQRGCGDAVLLGYRSGDAGILCWHRSRGPGTLHRAGSWHCCLICFFFSLLFSSALARLPNRSRIGTAPSCPPQPH